MARTRSARRRFPQFAPLLGLRDTLVGDTVFPGLARAIAALVEDD